MADSLSKQVILAIVAKLQAAGLPDGASITRSRTIAIADTASAEISVYRIEEDLTTTGNPRASVLDQRNLIVEIAISAFGGDDACDPYHQWVVQQMAADRKLGGLIKSITEIKTAWDPDEGSSGTSMTVFVRFRVEYFTPPGDITKTI